MDATNAKLDVSSVEAIEQKLRALIRQQESVLVALSGGVDSSVVAALAAQELSDRALAVTGVSASLAGPDLQRTEEFCATFGIAHSTVTTNELANNAYVENSTDRCYFCKNELFTKLGGLASQRGFARILDGTTHDDLDTHRPGLIAAMENNVLSPLVEVGATKADVRALARGLGLPNADCPASPCLSSRIAFGTHVTSQRLERIAASEAFLRTNYGLRELRVRLHGPLARIEVNEGDMAKLVEHAGAINEELRRLGFVYITLDLGGLRSGSLLEILDPRFVEPST